MTATDEPIEAVIISGPRRGEIVRLPEDAIPDVSEEDLKLLNRGLDLLETALDELEGEITATIELFQAPSRGEGPEVRAGEEAQSHATEVRERIARTAELRRAHRARLHADLAQFELDVGQAMLRFRSLAVKEVHP